MTSPSDDKPSVPGKPSAFRHSGVPGAAASPIDPATAAYYARDASDVVARYEAAPSPLAPYLAAAFAEGARILDIGIGSGRDLALMLARGYDAWGVEPVAELAALAAQRHPELAGRIAAGALPPIGRPFGGGFDGIVCSAVLMHVPEADLFDAAFALRGLLKPHGRLVGSLPLARGDVGEDRRDAQGRLFEAYAPDYLQLLFERIGFRQIGRWDSADALARADTRWYTLLFELSACEGLRAVDRIEGVLNRDRKVATYKLALFRALAELATQEPRCAQFRGDGRVGVPIRRIAEKWLGYYWPIFASGTLVPQSQDEGSETGRRLAFRNAVAALMAPYRDQGAHGGLTAWDLDLLRGRLAPPVQDRLEAALRAIEQAIRAGPVQYAGGALETGRVFGYERGGSVLVPADIWRELSLLGHWIADAVVLRWAELTARFAHRQNLGASDVLPLLTARPEASRATDLARAVFLREGVRQCTWSDRPLGARFAVDHAIPFSLWGNNDLWNLLPVDAGVNNRKSDKLPSAELLQARRGSIVHAWHLLRDAMPAAFDAQAAHLLGRPLAGPLAWEAELHGRLREAIELTALQRGVARWAP